jgi:hypothetical protein
MSDPGRHAALFDGLPCDVRALAKIVQGLLIHQHIAPAYGVPLNRGSSVLWRGPAATCLHLAPRELARSAPANATLGLVLSEALVLRWSLASG